MIKEIAKYAIRHDHLFNPLKFGEINLLQVARCYFEPQMGINPHTHINWFELTAITSGEGTILTNGEPCPVKTGDVHLSFPYEVHEIRADKNVNLEYDCLSFSCDGDSFKKYFNDISITHSSATSRVFKDEKIAPLIASAISELSAKKLYSDEIMTSLLTQTIVYIIRNFNNVESNDNDITETKILCLQIMNYIDTHIYSLKNLQEVADKFNYNYSYLSFLFKKVTNKTLSEYMRNKKLEIAKTLIIEGKKKINEVAEMLNYSSLFAFSKAFKLKFGVSPSKISNNNF